MAIDHNSTPLPFYRFVKRNSNDTATLLALLDRRKTNLSVTDYSLEKRLDYPLHLILRMDEFQHEYMVSCFPYHNPLISMQFLLQQCPNNL